MVENHLVFDSFEWKRIIFEEKMIKSDYLIIFLILPLMNDLSLPEFLSLGMGRWVSTIGMCKGVRSKNGKMLGAAENRFHL
jgi:hypothetical protein